MRFLKIHDFGEVCGLELGWSPVGKPLMTTMCYRFGPVLIDTGLAHMRSEVLRMAEENPVEVVLLTHYHEDHSGNAAAIKAGFNVPVYGSAQTLQKLAKPYGIYPYQHLIWGATDSLKINMFPDNLELNGVRFIPVHTPGHSRDHTVYFVSGHGWLFSGDLFLSSRIKYFRADEKIDEQIVSLKKVLTLDFDTLFCGHHPKAENGKAAIVAKLQYLEDFYGKVAELAQSGMAEGRIMETLHLKEQTFIKLLCFGNVSMKNMVRSVMRSIPQE